MEWGLFFFWKEGSASFNKNFIDDFVEQRRYNELSWSDEVVGKFQSQQF
jgi:hypothetical protein